MVRSKKRGKVKRVRVKSHRGPVKPARVADEGFRARVRFTVKDFFFFLILFVVSLLLYKFVSLESYVVLFGLLAIVFGFIALAFLIVLLVLFFMRFLKK